VVDSTGDQPDVVVGSEACKTSVDTCTLRAAIEESNFSIGAPDEIKFAAMFDGRLAGTIALGSSLSPIVDPVHIDGDGAGQCVTEAGVSGPCVGVDSPLAGSAVTVENANEVHIEGLAITGATGNGAAAIDVIDNSEEFVARDNWIGVKLDGKAGGNAKGVFIGPGSDDAVIGGIDAADRNVISHSVREGLDVEGASGSVVQGNYFGVTPKGSEAAENLIDIEVTDSTAGGDSEANDTEIGATIEGAALTTTACDGGCNVISRAITGIDLVGQSAGSEMPASGPTAVHGNYVGLRANGKWGAGIREEGVLVGAATDVTVGGPGEGDANYLLGGRIGINHEGGDGFEARGNVIGFDAFGFGGDLLPEGGVSVNTLGLTEPVAVRENTVATPCGAGIQARFGGVEIIDNVIEGSCEGIFAGGDPGLAGGNLIAGNLINETGNGIFITNDLNEVFGNDIFDSGQAGISIFNSDPLTPPTENVIGGDLPVDENTISGSGSRAIEIGAEFEAGENANEVARNNGAFNEGRFIRLLGDANDGIQPPSFMAATPVGASGNGAEAGATIRVFRKAGEEVGELESFLAEAIADEDGSWEVTYPDSIPGKTTVAATQTSEAGATSELSTAKTVPGHDEGGDGKEKEEGDATCLFSGGYVPCRGGGPALTVPRRRSPRTEILAGPKGQTRSSAVKLEFSSNEKDAKFECKLDRKKFKPCKSPKTYKGLKPGKHVFKVRAVKGENVDSTPAKRKFMVLE
jgi:hypothetical protein